MSNTKNCWNTSLHGHRKVSRPPSIYIPPSPRKRRDDKRGDTRVPVPVPDPSLLVPFADAHSLNARRRLPDSTESTSVPVVRLARVAVLEQHPLDGVLQLSSRRGWARLGEQCTFFKSEKSAKKPLHQAPPRHHSNQLESEKTKTLANPVQGENLEDLHREYQRSARHLLNSVLGENPPCGTGMSTVCSIIRCNEENDTIVCTSTS